MLPVSHLNKFRHTSLVQIICFWSYVFPIISKVQGLDNSMMQAVRFTPGGPENLSIGSVPVPELRDREVLIKISASAINRADTHQRRGTYPPPAGESDILGLEAAGTVHNLGPGATRWKIGDRVMALLPGGGNAQFTRAFEDHLMPIPASMPFTTAAAIPEVWLTAYQLLHFVGHMKNGDTVLIHAGGSGVGTAAVQLVKIHGGKAIVTAGTQGKIDKAKSLGAEAGFNYKEGNFAEKVFEHTGGQGVDLIIDCVGASFWEQNAASIKLDGRWVLYGSMGGLKIEGDLMAKILRKRIQLTGSTLRTRSKEYKTELISAFSKNILPHFENNTMKTVIDCIMPLREIQAAHTKMEANLNTGKIILQVLEETDTHSEL